MLTTGAPPNILIRANIYNNDPIRYIVLVVSCFVLPIPNIYRDTSVLIPSLSGVRGGWPRPSTHARATPAPGGHRSDPRGPTRAVSGGYDLDWDSTPSPGFSIRNFSTVLLVRSLDQTEVCTRLITQLLQQEYGFTSILNEFTSILNEKTCLAEIQKQWF